MKIRNLSVLSYANGFTLWHYRAGESPDEVAKGHFWSEAGDMLSQGDLIMVTTHERAPAFGKMLLVEKVKPDTGPASISVISLTST